jgi:hypothetical protein
LSGAATTAGTVTTNSQPNITSTGTLTGLTVNGIVNATGASNISLGAIGNIHITGGSSGYTIKTDGLGNLSWGVDTAAAGGTNTQVQFNNAGSLDASANLTFNNTTNILTLAGNIQTDNANLGNSAVANYFTGNFFGRANTSNTVLVAAQPNITSLGTLTSLTVAGGVANLGNVSNVKILGGAGYLYNDLSNNLTYQAVVTQSIPGTANTLLYSSGSNNIISSGNIKFNDPQLDIIGTLSVSGNANVGNIGATTVSATTLAGSLTTNAQPNITSVGTLAGLTVSSAGLIVSGAGNVNAGNITATGVFAGNGANLTTLTGSNVTGTVANATYATSAGSATNAAALLTTLTSSGTVHIPFISATSNGNYALLSNANFSANLANGAITATTFVGALSGAATSATTAGTVTTNAQPNITSTGTLTSLGVSGNITAANITANTGVFTGNGSGLSAIAGANVTGTVSSATSATTAGTVTTNAQPNITSTGTLTSLGVSGNITAANITANTGVFTGNGSGLTALNASNISTGTLAQSRLANATLTLGNTTLTLGNTTTTVAGLTSVTSTTFVGALSGAATSATSATTAGTVTTNAQPNITSVGTLTSITSTGNVEGANVIATAYHIRSVGTGITAAGTTQGAGTVLSKEINIVSTVASGANAVVLPTAVAGMIVSVTNTTANAMLVFPASGGQINSLGPNISFSQSTTTIQFIAPSSTQWYTVGATYA